MSMPDTCKYWKKMGSGKNYHCIFEWQPRTISQWYTAYCPMGQLEVCGQYKEPTYINIDKLKEDLKEYSREFNINLGAFEEILNKYDDDED